MSDLFLPANALGEPLSRHLARACGLNDSAEGVDGAEAAEAAGEAKGPECGGLGGWASVVGDWLESAAGRGLVAAVEARQMAGARVYPSQVLRALQLTPLAAVRVLILGQDPYHGPGQAQGLAFSVPAGMRLPPSLRNILRELQRDLGAVSEQAAAGDLSAWARQGVLLLNTCLTVEEGTPGAHARLGWESLTDALVQAVAARPQPLAALLWGAQAQAKTRLLQAGAPAASPRLMLQSNHPSPLSARRPPVPFLGCGHFSQVQSFLAACEPERPPITW